MRAARGPCQADRPEGDRPGAGRARSEPHTSGATWHGAVPARGGGATWRRAATFGLVALAAWAGCAGPPGPDGGLARGALGAGVGARADEPAAVLPRVTLRHVDEPLRAVVAAISSEAGVTIDLAGDAGDRRVTTALVDLRWDEALAAAACAAGLQVAERAGKLVVGEAPGGGAPWSPRPAASGPPGAERAGATGAPGGSAAALSTPIDVDLVDASLAEAAVQLERASGVPFVAAAGLEGVVTLRLRGIPVGEAAALIARIVGCELVREPGAPPTFAPRACGTTIQLVRADLAALLALVAAHAGVQLVVGPGVEAEASVTLWGRLDREAVVDLAHAAGLVVERRAEVVLVGRSRLGWGAPVEPRAGRAPVPPPEARLALSAAGVDPHVLLTLLAEQVGHDAIVVGGGAQVDLRLEGGDVGAAVDAVAAAAALTVELRGSRYLLRGATTAPGAPGPVEAARAAPPGGRPFTVGPDQGASGAFSLEALVVPEGDGVPPAAVVSGFVVRPGAWFPSPRSRRTGDDDASPRVLAITREGLELLVPATGERVVVPW